MDINTGLDYILINHDKTGLLYIITGIMSYYAYYRKTTKNFFQFAWPSVFILSLLITTFQVFYYLGLSAGLFVFTHIFDGGTVFIRHYLMQLILALGSGLFILRKLDIIIHHRLPLTLLGIGFIYLGFHFLTHHLQISETNTYDEYDGFSLTLIGIAFLICGISYIIEIMLPKYKFICRGIWSVGIIFIGFLFLVTTPHKVLPVVGTIEKYDTVTTYFLGAFALFGFIAILFYLIREIQKRSLDNLD